MQNFRSIGYFLAKLLPLKNPFFANFQHLCFYFESEKRKIVTLKTKVVQIFKLYKIAKFQPNKITFSRVITAKKIHFCRFLVIGLLFWKQLEINGHISCSDNQDLSFCKISCLFNWISIYLYIAFWSYGTRWAIQAPRGLLFHLNFCSLE